MENIDKYEAYSLMKKEIIDYYEGLGGEYKEELIHFHRILRNNIGKLKEKDISSSGYVVSTLEASLRAINLGGDTDTIGAIAGGMAGAYYGYEKIPDEWVNETVKKDDILQLIDEFLKACIQL